MSSAENRDAGGASGLPSDRGRAPVTGLPQVPEALSGASHPPAPAAPGLIPAWIARITSIPPRVRTALRWALLISLFMHFVALPFILPRASDKLRSAMEKSKNTYLAKMMQKERGKIRGNEIRSLVKPPPLPPDPQQYAQKAIADVATKGVVQVTSKLLPVEIQESMVKHIETTLADEIREMAEKVRKRELTPEQYRKRQDDLQEKVFVVAQQYGEMIREDGQIHIATESVTDWYEKRVANQFKAMIRQDLLTENRGQWYQVFARENPGFLRSRRDDRGETLPYEAALNLLDRVVTNRFVGQIKTLPDEAKGQTKDIGNGWWTFPDTPSLAHAAAVAFMLNEQHKTWDEDCADYFSRFYPHRMAEAAKEKTAMDALWQKILPAAETYRKRAASGAGAAALAKDHQDLLALVKSLRERGEKLAVRFGNPKDAQYGAVSQALRSRLARGPFLDEIHTYLVDRIVQRIKPAVINLAQNEFREGMVYSKDGVEKAIKDFGVSSVSLLRRDISDALTVPLLQRGLFLVGTNPYRSPLSGAGAPPSGNDIARDEQALTKAVSQLPSEDKAYVEKRAEAIKTEIKASVDRTIEQLLKLMVDKDGVLARNFYAKADTVDYTDHLQVRLELRNLALKGRGQDLADITEDGVPDTANPRVALVAAVEAGQVVVQPVLTSLHPDFYVTAGRSAQALRASPPFFGTAPPADWGFATQVKVEPLFQSPAFEAIPFLVTPPRLDGDLSDWGGVRPLELRRPRGELPYVKENLKLYAGWNYQGFFFGYHVDQPRSFFSRSSEYTRGTDGVSLVKRREGDYGWLIAGDCLILCFDTIDTRAPIRGDANTQEFFILPEGTESDPATPGAEKVVASRRDAQVLTEWGNWPYCRCSFNVFPSQPAEGPDGAGPFRVMRPDGNGYTVEVFLPRSLFKAPVFCPGWYTGFDCAIGIGGLMQGEGRPFMGNYATFGTTLNRGLNVQHPGSWGDLLLLGTDAEVTIQDAENGWPNATAVVPGHSYLFTVVDPDHNVNPAAEDTVLVSAEVLGDGGRVDDVEVFVLKETGNNTGVFRGMINTQPGSGRQAHGIVEVLPGKEVRFAYEDFGDARGRRNVLHEIKLPVVSSLMNLAETERKP